MWARVIELLLAVWLGMSPFFLRGTFQNFSLWISASLVAFFSLLSLCNPLKRSHLLTMGVALWLWGSGYSTFPEMASPLEENLVIVGLLLLMLAIVPNQSHLRSPSWRKFDLKNFQ